MLAELVVVVMVFFLPSSAGVRLQRFPFLAPSLAAFSLNSTCFELFSNPQVKLEVGSRNPVVVGRMGRWYGLVKVVSWLCLVGVVSGIGVNWGTQASHPLPPDTVVRMLRDNGFQKVKLFDPEDSTMSALSKSGIQVMVGIPNEMLAGLASSMKAAEDWVSKNVSSYIKDGVDIRSSF